MVSKSFNSPTTVTDTDVTLDLKNLNEETTYYYQLYAIDGNSNIHRGEVLPFNTTKTPTIIIESLSITKTCELIGEAYLNPEGNTILEAGFLYRSDNTEVSLTYDYNGKTVKVPCEIISNKINLYVNRIGDGFSSNPSVYVRAYMILLDGTIIYNGNKIFVAGDYPYPRN